MKETLHFGEVFYYSLENITSNYTMYLPMAFNNGFDCDVFTEAAQFVIKQIPKFSSRVKENFFRAEWILEDEYLYQKLFSHHFVEDISDTDHWQLPEYREIIHTFFNEDHRFLHLDRTPAIKFFIYQSQTNHKAVVVLCIHHAIADGRGALQLLDLIAKTYSSMIRKGDKPVFVNYDRIDSKDVQPIKPDEPDESLTIQYSEKDKARLPIFEGETIDLNQIPEKEKMNAVYIKADDLNLIKRKYEKYRFTTSDIINRWLFQLLFRYSESDPNPRAYLNLGLPMDSRRQLPSNITTITNFTTMTILKIPRKDILDDEKLGRYFMNHKKTFKGYQHDLALEILSVFPFRFQKAFLRWFVGPKINQASTQGFQVSDLGEISHHLSDFDATLDYIEFIAASSRIGAPKLTTSRYKGHLSLHFYKLDDANDIAGDCKRRFEQMIQEELMDEYS